jgi:hypothetical protein
MSDYHEESLHHSENENEENEESYSVDHDEDDLHSRRMGGASTVDFHNSFLDIADRNDPNYLYSLLQDALPKQTELANNPELQQQRRERAETTWEKARRWLWANPSLEARRAAADVRGVGETTCLHLVCKLHNPPEDIVAALVEAADDTVYSVDNHGWLPLHHACANGACTEVLKILVDHYPAGKVTQDQQNRTPLHFYATRNSDNPAAMAVNLELLADSGAAELADKSGMLPIHYACAYGTHPVVLKALCKVYPTSLTARENNGRTPMHLAMVNAHRDESPNVMRFLLDNPAGRSTINTRDNVGYLPLHLLAVALKGFKSKDHEKRTNISECLSMYLDAEPRSTPDFLTAIQDLPDWLQDTAVVSKHVRNILNEKIVKRFPTSILMLDGIFLIVLIIFFARATHNHIDLRFDPENTENYTRGSLIMIFVGASYFLLREIVQFGSLMSLGNLSSWWSDPANWLDMCVIVLSIYYGILMVDPENGSVKDNTFRSGAAVTQGVLWVAIIVYLKSTLVDFAVFVGGVFYVVRRLVAFLIATGTVLLAFAQMFFFVYYNTELCEPSNTGDPDLDDCRFPHCTFGDSLLKVYSMMMGEIGNESRYSTNLPAQILYVAYGFLVVILLSNVLIAIVTDSYEVIQNDRAAIVFWSNRLDFVAEMDAITYAVQRRLGYHPKSGGEKELKNDFPPEAHRSTREHRSVREHRSTRSTRDEDDLESPIEADPNFLNFEESNEFFREAWHQVMLLFDDNLYDDIDWIETWVYNVFRIFSIFCVIPLWVALGAITAGWLWPPQIREWLFVQKETAVSRAEIERQKLGQLTSIQNDLKILKQEILREMACDRDEMIRMKADVETVQGEVFADLQQVKELMDSLLAL